MADSVHPGDTAGAFAPADAGGGESTLRRFNSIPLVWVTSLTPAALLSSRDVYSYLMQGVTVHDRFDPYIEGAVVNSGPVLLEISADWRNTTAPYGPLYSGIGEAITRIVGDSTTAGVILYCIMCLLGFAVIAWLILRIARVLGVNPAFA